MRERTYQEIRWPYSGLHVGRAYAGQPHDTSVDLANVRNFDPNTGRSRGGQRAGLLRYPNAQASGTGNKQIQCIVCVVTHPTDAVSLTNLQAHDVTALSVCAGNVQSFTSSSYAAVTSGTGALSATAPVIFAAQYKDDVYFADGATWAFFDGSVPQMDTWAAGAGDLPVSGSNKPRLICEWRARIVLGGLKGDPFNWFMSAVGDPTDFDYSVVTSTAAVSGTGSVGPAEMPDVIMSFVPYTDDTLLVGCDHTIFQFSGDPAFGGTIDLVSDITGMAFGEPWCKLPDGRIMFFGSRGGIYLMAPGGPGRNTEIVRVSQDRIEEGLATVNLNTTLVRMIYDDRTQGVHIFLTELDQSASTHYYYDLRKDAFFKDTFVDPLYNPVAVATFDGTAVADRVVLLGGFDRRIRAIDYDGTNDDAEAIRSYAWLGPLQADQGAKIHLNDISAVLEDSCNGAYYEVYGGEGAQAAYSRGQLFHSGQWIAGRNAGDNRRASGTSIYIKVGNDSENSYFALERIMAALEKVGMTAGRQPATR